MTNLRLPRAAIMIAAFFIAGAAGANEPGLLERFGAVFDGIAKTLKAAGDKSKEFFSPPFAPLKDVGVMDFSGLATAPRTFDRSFPAGAAATVSIANEFGDLRIDTWDQSVVRVTAQIYAGAQTQEQAIALAEAIAIEVEQTDDGWSIRTVYPNGGAFSQSPLEVNYVLTLPHTASVIASNSFGDVSIEGLGGTVTLDARYGAVDLTDIRGLVNLQARGDLPVLATGLGNGGNFSLLRCPAIIRNASGPLRINSFMGAVEIRDLTADCDLDVTTESAEIRLYYPGDAPPSLLAESFFGQIQADEGVQVRQAGHIATARITGGGSTGRVQLRSTFNSIALARQPVSGPAVAAPATTANAELFEGAVERSAPVTEGMVIYVDAMRGDVVIEATDEPVLKVLGAQLVRIPAPDQAPEAIEALSLQIEEEPAKLTVRSQVIGDMTRTGATDYRLNLRIACPRQLPVRVRATDGKTSITGLDGPIWVTQEQGAISVEQVKGEMNIVNNRGAIDVSRCAGQVTLTTTNGGVSTYEVYGPQTITAANGRVIVDAPRGELKITQRGGDVRLLALEGIFGNFEVDVQSGNLAIVTPPETDASFIVTVENGTWNSLIPLTGTSVGKLHKFTGPLKTGPHTVILKTKDGALMID